MWISDQGIQVCIQLDYLARTPVRHITAFGANGQVSVDLISQMIAIQKPGKEQKTIDLKASHDEMYIEQAKAFLRAIEGKDSDQLASGNEGLAAIAICDAARRSSQNRGADEVVSW
jgi:predicted dehydrogenase